MLFKKVLLKNYSQINRISKRNILNWQVGWMFKPWPKPGTEGYKQRVKWSAGLYSVFTASVFLGVYVVTGMKPSAIWDMNEKIEYLKRQDEKDRLAFEEKHKETIELLQKRVEMTKQK